MILTYAWCVELNVPVNSSNRNNWTHVAVSKFWLIFRPVANQSLLCGWIVKSSGQLSRIINGPWNMLSRDRSCGLQPLLTALEQNISLYALISLTLKKLLKHDSKCYMLLTVLYRDLFWSGAVFTWMSKIQLAFALALHCHATIGWKNSRLFFIQSELK